MTEVKTCFAVPSDEAFRGVRDALERRFQLKRSPLPARLRTYYDTFDGRLHRHGGALFAIEGGGDGALVWEAPDGTPRHHLRGATAPAFARDLPAGPFRDALAAVTDIRRLLPLVALEARGEALRVLDGERKTVARLTLEERDAVEPASPLAPRARGRARRRPLPPALCAVPVKGYGAAFRRVLEAVEDLGFEPVPAREAEEALEALGREVGGVASGRPRVAMDAQQRADAATRELLRVLFETLLANEPGTRRDLDPEFLHDFRVAVRRTRSALGQIKGVFPRRDAERFRREFSWLGKATGPTRDLDVYLLKMDTYKADLPPAVARDLAPLEEFLRRHQGEEQRRLTEALDSPRYRRLVSRWRAFLKRPLPARPTAPAALSPVGEVASRRIWQAWRRVIRKGERIGEESPDGDLHALRIQCKKLRYLMEFFHGLYEAEEIDRLIKALKKLQDNLGDFNDLSVQQAHLAEFARRMAAEGAPPPETLLAMGRLQERLAERQTAEREGFARRFERFARRRNRQRAGRLFREGA